MAIEKVFSKTLRQQIYTQLRDKIIQAEFLPGETITLRDLAAAFGVSLMPVREALWQLESERIVVVENSKRIYVNSMTVKELEEAVRLRIALESMAAEMACDLRPEGEIPKVKKLLKGMEDSVDRPKIYMRRNTQFHDSVYFYSDSPMLLEMIERLQARVGPYVYCYAVSNPHNLPHGIECHWKIFEALKDRNKEGIKKAVAEDLQSIANLIIPSLMELPARRDTAKKLRRLGSR